MKEHSHSHVTAAVEQYHTYYQGEAEQRRRDYTDVVNTYYDLATDFYEFGWGQSFHFAPRAKFESFSNSILRHQHWLALRLALKSESQVLDVGCGVGGPLLNIARFADCRITGLNNNEYQVKRAQRQMNRAGLDELCTVMQGDFMAMPFPDNSFDAAYAIEATVHAPRLSGAYAEIARVLKPGSLVASYEWAMTSAYDPADLHHRRILADIEFGNGIAHLSTEREVAAAVTEAGLELIQLEDRMNGSEVTWFERLAPATSPFTLRATSGVGKHIINKSLWLLEALRIAPRGTHKVSKLLDRGGQALVAAGQLGIFTPALLVVARKPLN